MVTGVGTAGAATTATWPSTPATHYVGQTLLSCETPVQELL
jgi:hypothetical protein